MIWDCRDLRSGTLNCFTDFFLCSFYLFIYCVLCRSHRNHGNTRLERTYKECQYLQLTVYKERRNRVTIFNTHQTHWLENEISSMYFFWACFLLRMIFNPWKVSLFRVQLGFVTTLEGSEERSYLGSERLSDMWFECIARLTAEWYHNSTKDNSLRWISGDCVLQIISCINGYFPVDMLFLRGLNIQLF